MRVIEIIMKTSWGKVLAVLMLFAVSCGKDSKNPLGHDTSQTVKTEQAGSSVRTDEIGGESLTVISAYKDAASVAENKTFNTEVSKIGTQLLFVTDENQQLRGMTISVVEEKGSRILDVDATSTAYSLLLLTPGIATTSPAETSERLRIFDSLNSFHTLAAHLREHLTTQSLPTVVENETTQQLLAGCIEEYAASLGGSPGVLYKKAVDFHDFYINRKVDSKGKEFVELENYGWRHVHVRRKDFTGTGATSVAVVRNNMKGVEPHSSGAYVWWLAGDLKAGNPTVLADETYPPGKDLTGIGTPDAVTRSEYWIYGPGFKSNNLSLPTDVQLSMTVTGPWIWTIYSYIVKPLLGLTGGIPLGEVTSLSDLDVVSTIESSAKAISNINQLISMDDPLNLTDLAVSLTNTTISMVGIAAKTVGASLGWKFAATFFVGGNFGFSVANLWDAVPYLMGTPRVMQQELHYQVQPQTYSVSGRVLENGSGLPGVTVFIMGTDGNASTTTNNKGEYSFTGIVNGTYILTISKTEYFFSQQNIILTVNGDDATVSDIAATKSTTPQPYDVEGITFVSIPGGTFQMGDVEGVWGEGSDEKPVHTVKVSSFEMSIYEVTSAQYAAYLNAALASGDITITNSSVTGTAGAYSNQVYIYLLRSYFLDGTRCRITYNNNTFSVESGSENWPVAMVTWYGAKAFALYYGFDLPTESEWEYACRGGRQYEYGTDDGTISSAKANYGLGIYRSKEVDVGSYPVNPFGLYDMSGNVQEWCHDWYGAYPIGNVTNPTGPQTGSERVIRGGCWRSYDIGCRSACRYSLKPDGGLTYMGFRVVRRASSQNY